MDTLDTEKLEQIAKSLVVRGKGLLAADTSNKTTKKRFDTLKVKSTAETRREYRELLFTTPGAEKFLTGVILYDETFWQHTHRGGLFREYLKRHGIIPGIKVDKGLVDLPGFPGEKITQGLDGLPETMVAYAAAGAKFAKWRAVIAIGRGTPTDECIEANAYVLARYARICQEAGVVPIVEPEVLLDGDHSSERCAWVMARTFEVLFNKMRAYRVYLPGAILKTSMVLPGKDSNEEMDHNAVADHTIRILHDFVPHELGGVVFLSGGQSTRDAFINLDRIIKRGPHPWGITFSYDRAIQDPVLKKWASDRTAKTAIQEVFNRQLELVSDASDGELNESKLVNDKTTSQSQD